MVAVLECIFVSTLNWSLGSFQIFKLPWQDCLSATEREAEKKMLSQLDRKTAYLKSSKLVICFTLGLVIHFICTFRLCEFISGSPVHFIVVSWQLIVCITFCRFSTELSNTAGFAPLKQRRKLQSLDLKYAMTIIII